MTVEVRPLDLADAAAGKRWFAAFDTAMRAGRVAPVEEPQQAVLTALRESDDGSDPDTDLRAYAAWEGDTCLGTALLTMPRQENLHLAEINVAVPPQHRGQGVGAACYDTVLRVARAHGRTTLGDEVNVPHGQRLDETPGGRFALARGFASKHVEHRLLLVLPADVSHLQDVERSAQSHAGDYQVVSWVGVPPDRWREQFAALHTGMDRDLPIGELAREPMVWDAARVEAQQLRFAEQGYDVVTSLALSARGEAAAYTTVLVVPGDADVLQEDTFVLAGHRGHRLGALVKLANLRLLAQRYPGARRVHTWTSERNAAMLRINEGFGFRAVETVHEVELTLAPLGSPEVHFGGGAP